MDPAAVEELARRLASGICTTLGLMFVDCSFRAGRGKQAARLLVRVDRTEGVGVDDCATLSRLLGQRLDETDPLERSYVLEVSSVGLSEPLKTDQDFQRCLCRRIEVWPEGKGVELPVTGRLVAFGPETLTLEVGGDPVELPRSAVRRARPAADFRGTGAAGR